MAMRSLLQSLSPQGPRGRLSVLIFHRVLREADPLLPDEFDAARFDAVCAWLRRWFQVLPLATAVRHLRDGTLPARAAAITFDDGYADNAQVALPILQRHGLCATVFVATGFLDGGRMWNDVLIESVRHACTEVLHLGDLAPAWAPAMPVATVDDKRHAVARLLEVARYLPTKLRADVVAEVAKRTGARLPASPMMRHDEVLKLHRAGVSIGGHTVTHPILASLPEAEARREIVEGRRALEAITGAPVDLFAYPNGRPNADYDARTVGLVREAGFSAAVSTAWGAARPGVDLHQIPRFTPWDRTPLRFGLRMARNLWASRRVDAATA
jgi:peptidoglycan/xylan/chitin deacetylase (PgdA/CDA1 family)